MSDIEPVVIEGTVVERLINARRMPVVPAWIRDDVTRRAAAKYAVIHASHITAFHAVRMPKYAAKTIACSPRGLARVAHQITWWALDRQTGPLISSLVAADDHRNYRLMKKDQAERVKFRIGLLAFGVPLCAACGALVAVAVPAAGQAALCALTVGLLGYAGRPLGRVWLDVPLIAPRAEKPSPDSIVQALNSLGIPGITQALARDSQAIRFAIPGTGVGRDGPGWRADLDLPHGITAGMVLEKREQLASGLRRPLGCVWPEGDDSEHPGRLVLFIGDKDLSKAGKLPWPPVKGHGPLDIFRPLPFGVDPRGRQIKVPLVQHNVLIGSIVGQGKTSAVRVLASAAALDPTCEMWIHELKGTGDLDAFEQVSHRFVSGIDDESIAYAAGSLAMLRAEVMRRTARFKQLPLDLVPDKHVTREVASKRSLGLHPLVCIIDECQNLFGSPQHGTQAGEDANMVIRIGRALGVILILATQRPDKESLPTGITANVSIRYCLKVMDQWTNDAILGTSSYKNGLRATTFRPELDAGIGLLVATRGPQVTRAYYVDAEVAKQIGMRARALRAAAGLLTGVAAGEADPVQHVSLLADVASVMRGEPKQHSRVLCARLGELRPEMYAGWDATTLANALAHFDVDTGQLWVDGANGRGVVLADVQGALAGSRDLSVRR